MGNTQSASVLQPTTPHPGVAKILTLRPSTTQGQFSVRFRGQDEKTQNLPDSLDFPMDLSAGRNAIALHIEDEEVLTQIKFFLYAHHNRIITYHFDLEEVSSRFGQDDLDPWKKCHVPLYSTKQQTHQPAATMIFENRPIVFTLSASKSITLYTPVEVGFADQIASAKKLLLKITAAILQYYEKHLMVIEGGVKLLINVKGAWETLKTNKPRDIKTLFLPNQQKEGIMQDLARCQENQERLVKMGFPSKRGYLLSGPPGTGKTSLILALAGHYHFNICLLSLSEPGLCDTSLSQLVRNMPNKSVLVLEDVDRMFVHNVFKGPTTGVAAPPIPSSMEIAPMEDDAKAPEKVVANGADFAPPGFSGVSLSALLGVLDGAYSEDRGQVVFITTNNRDILDPALIRPGRIDYEMKMSYANATQVANMCRALWQTSPDQDQIVEHVVSLFPAQEKHQITMAAVMSRLVPYISRPTEEILGLTEISW
jgi:hypothetical protein